MVVNSQHKTSHHISTESKYLSEDKFRERIQLDTCKQDKPFSLFHLNICSLRKKFAALEEYLSCIGFEFSIYGISETWLNDYCWIVLHEWLYSGGETQKHKGWWRSCFAMSRINRVYWTKGPGGVQWPYRIYLYWNRQQSVWYGENIIVGVIYQPPGTDINQFN